MKRSYFSLLVAAIVGVASAQQATYQIPSNTGAQQAVVGPNNVTVQPRRINELQVIPEGTAVMPPKAAQVRSNVPVKRILLDNNGQARLRGSVRGLGMDVYHFSGNAGDRIHIISNRSKAMAFAIFRPDIGMRFGNQQILPQTGEYELRIVNDRKNAAYNKTPRYYDVRFNLIRGGNAQYAPAVSAQPASTYAANTATTVNVQYRCDQGNLAVQVFPLEQIILLYKGQSLALAYQANDSNALQSIYSNGVQSLQARHPNGRNQSYPEIVQVINAGKVVATNCSVLR